MKISAQKAALKTSGIRNVGEGETHMALGLQGVNTYVQT